MVLVACLWSVSPADLLRMSVRLALLSAGRGTLDCVHAPAFVEASLSPRALRLIRSSRVSAW